MMSEVRCTGRRCTGRRKHVPPRSVVDAYDQAGGSTGGSTGAYHEAGGSTGDRPSSQVTQA